MLRIASKNQTRQRVHDRIRKKVMGTPERPRLNVYRSLNHIYVQLIDDLKGVTLVAASTANDRKGARVTGGNVASAKVVGKKIAELAKQKGYTKVVFDRGARRRGRSFGGGGRFRIRQGEGSSAGHPQGDRGGEEEPDQDQPDADDGAAYGAGTLWLGHGAAEAGAGRHGRDCGRCGARGDDIRWRAECADEIDWHEQSA